MGIRTTTSRGFTLIELLVVIAIIGLLASVVLASLNSARAKARDARRLSDVKQIQLALELYYDTYGSYPGAGTPSSGCDGSSLCVHFLQGNANFTQFLPTVPMDPTSSSPYFYRYHVSPATSYAIAIVREDGGQCGYRSPGYAASLGGSSVPCN